MASPEKAPMAPQAPPNRPLGKVHSTQELFLLETLNVGAFGAIGAFSGPTHAE